MINSCQDSRPWTVSTKHGCYAAFKTQRLCVSFFQVPITLHLFHMYVSPRLLVLFGTIFWDSTFAEPIVHIERNQVTYFGTSTPSVEHF
jgi:hypothetical protein